MPKWNIESVHSKNLVAILHLLVALVRHFRAPVRLPENVYVTVVIAQKNGTVLSAQKYQEQLTSQYDDVGMRCERDAFDTLFDCAPDKLAVVKKVCFLMPQREFSTEINDLLTNNELLPFQSLITFVNKHLNKLNFEVNNLNTDFKDGVYLCLLMGLLGGFFVPLYDFHLTPKSVEHMVS